MRRILILRGGALGDFIVTLPALALLRSRWPESRIELVGNSTAAQLALHRGLVDAVHSQHEGRWSALYLDRKLNEPLAGWLTGFDLVVNYWPDPDATLARHFPLHASQAVLSAAALPGHGPAAAHYCESLRTLGLVPDQFWLPLLPLSGATGMRHGIVLHPGSGSVRKNWPADRWLELITRLEGPVALILGEAELATWECRLPELRQLAHVTVLASFPLEALVAACSSAALFLGHDSGISHLAAATGAPSVLLFGPTDPAIWAPPEPTVRVLRRGSTVDAIAIADVVKEIRDVLPTAVR
jgi:heptosyltransferase-3